MNNLLIKMDKSKHLYLQIYEYFKAAIESGQLEQDERLPSIRGLSSSLSVSKITVEKAYDQLLSEGYIGSNNRARYSVARIDKIGWDSDRVLPETIFIEKDVKSSVRFDFSSGEMDKNGFDFTLWKRYLNYALDEDSRLMSYGTTLGEPELRNEIVRYIHRSRGVSASAKQIVIGSSVQTLLGILCGLLDRCYPIAFEDPGFRHGRQVFLDYGYNVLPIGMGENGIDMETLSNSGAKAVYVSPSHQFPTGLIMSISKRNRLLLWAKNNSSLIIEDDYDSEFRYYGNPIPALKGLDREDRVVYIGSLSKFIPPSIRISYMLLPEHLSEKLQSLSSFYNPSASTLEQLALAKYMQDGNLERQIRRLRKIYQDKQKLFINEIRAKFGSSATIDEYGSGLFISLDLNLPLSPVEVKSRAEKQGCKVALVEEYSMKKDAPSGTKGLLLYFSSIPLEDIPTAVAALKKAWVD